MTADYNYKTEVFRTYEGLELTLDVLSTLDIKSDADKVALVHFHGGFLVVGEKQTFPPYWLIDACQRRGWTYVTPSYRLLPEARGYDTIEDALSAIQWVYKTITRRIIIAGSSAGGLLALVAAAQLQSLKPLAVLSIYGINDLSNDRYIYPGITFMGLPLMENSDTVIQDLKLASADSTPITEYPFPEDENDRRMNWIRAIHEGAIFPDVLCGIPGLANTIRTEGIQGVPSECRSFFPLHLGLDSSFPPTAFLHGDQDLCVRVDQSTLAAAKLQSLGIKTCVEIVPGKDHGFDAMEVSPGTNIEEAEDSELAHHLRNIIAFLDQAVRIK